MSTQQQLILLMVFAGLLVVSSASPGGQNISMINAAGLDAVTVESVRVHAERELYVPVVSVNFSPSSGRDLFHLGKQAAKAGSADAICIIVLGQPSEISALHYVIMTNEQVAVINVPSVSSTNASVFCRRLQRLTLRATASLFGIGSDPDPFCVMHDYRTLNDLDHLGMNFSPPWGAKFREAAKARGLRVRSLHSPGLKVPKIK
jgi:hypothetical protein